MRIFFLFGALGIILGYYEVVKPRRLAIYLVFCNSAFEGMKHYCSQGVITGFSVFTILHFALIKPTVDDPAVADGGAVGRNTYLWLLDV